MLIRRAKSILIATCLCACPLDAVADEPPPPSADPSPSEWRWRPRICTFFAQSALDLPCGFIVTGDVLLAYQRERDSYPGGPSLVRVGMDLSSLLRLGPTSHWVGIGGEVSFTSNQVRNGTVAIPMLQYWYTVNDVAAFAVMPGFLYEKLFRNGRGLSEQERLGFSGQAVVSAGGIIALWTGVEWLKAEGQTDEVRGFIGGRLSFGPLALLFR